MSADINEKAKTVLDDKDLMAKLEKAESAQEVSDLLATKDVVIDAATINEFMENQIELGELNEDDLDKVAGGFKLRYVNPFYWVGRLMAWAVTKDACGG